MYTFVVTDMYRQAASMLLLKPDGPGAYSILLLHKPRKKDAWQLPQGGMEGEETPEECAVRELEEEAGLADVRVLGRSDTIYQYDFPASYRRFRPDNICGQKIFFVFALSPHSEVTVTVDDKEVDQFQWVKVDTLPKFLKRKEYLELVKHLYDEALPLVQQNV